MYQFAGSKREHTTGAITARYPSTACQFRSAEQTIDPSNPPKGAWAKSILVWLYSPAGLSARLGR